MLANFSLDLSADLAKEVPEVFDKIKGQSSEAPGGSSSTSGDAPPFSFKARRNLKLRGKPLIKDPSDSMRDVWSQFCQLQSGCPSRHRTLKQMSKCRSYLLYIYGGMSNVQQVHGSFSAGLAVVEKTR